nr:hypothetical transcript [Hymenolepis microstoma]
MFCSFYETGPPSAQYSVTSTNATGPTSQLTMVIQQPSVSFYAGPDDPSPNTTFTKTTITPVSSQSIANGRAYANLKNSTGNTSSPSISAFSGSNTKKHTCEV